MAKSLPARGAWIEICSAFADAEDFSGRSPHGERGLKLIGRLFLRLNLCRSPHGERGLKFLDSRRILPLPPRRSPHGERGLKLSQRCNGTQLEKSLPARGAWIEIGYGGAGGGGWYGRSPHGERGLKSQFYFTAPPRAQSLPARGAWIEIAIRARRVLATQSLPARGAWIEIPDISKHLEYLEGRSPHGERGLKSALRQIWRIMHKGRSPHGERGLKFLPGGVCRTVSPSLPARGAWIEIVSTRSAGRSRLSLPARGAWIEIPERMAVIWRKRSRSPHGEP